MKWRANTGPWQPPLFGDVAVPRGRLRTLRIGTVAIEGDASSSVRAGKALPYLGLAVVIDAIQRQLGVTVHRVAPRDVRDLDVCLVSVTSPLALYDMARLAIAHRWRDAGGPFLVAGGAGVVNARAIAPLADAWVHGRGEDVITPIIRIACGSGDSVPPSVWIPAMGPAAGVVFAQARERYPHAIDGWRESNLGCENHCRFCGYRALRKRPQDATGRFGADAMYTHSAEMTLKDIKPDDWAGRMTIAVDGVSDRIRAAFRKPVSDGLIRRKLGESRQRERGMMCRIYQIVGVPTETDEERAAFIETLRRAVDLSGRNPPDAIHHYAISSTILQPEPHTACQYLPLDVSREWRFNWGDTGGRPHASGPGWAIWAHYMQQQATWNSLRRMIILRGDERDTPVVYAIARDSTKARGMERVEYMLAHGLDDPARIVGAYPIGQPGAWAYARSWEPRDVVDREAADLHRRLGLAGMEGDHAHEE